MYVRALWIWHENAIQTGEHLPHVLIHHNRESPSGVIKTTVMTGMQRCPKMGLNQAGLDVPLGEAVKPPPESNKTGLP